MSSFPAELFYTKEHEWAKLEGNLVTIGITHHAVEQLGDITYVGLPREDDDVEKEEVFGSVESVKAQSDIFSPVDGKVVKVNEELEDAPELVNEDPYEKGWMVQVEVEEASALDALMKVDEYKKFVAEEE